MAKSGVETIGGGATLALARFVAEAARRELPPDVLHQAKRCLVDWLGVTLGGCRDPSVDKLIQVVDLQGGSEQAGLIGRPRRVSLLGAALANAQATHILDYDDTLMSSETSLHGCAPTFPAAVAMGEWLGRPGRDVLAAFVLGFDVAARVALAAGKAHYNLGWHVTGTTGHLGAAATAGALLGLDADRLVQALGIAGTQAAGLKEVYGSDSKALHPAKAASDGIFSALLAERGFTGGSTILEGRYGFLNILTTGPHPERLTDGLGDRLLVLDDGFKPYACGSLVHAAIDATIALAEAHDLQADQVETITARVHPHVESVTGKSNPQTGLEAKFSLVHCLAVALVDRAAQAAQFTDARVQDPVVQALRRRVTPQVDETRARDEADVTVKLTDGREVRHHVPHASGTIHNPVSDAGLSAKFTNLAESVLGRNQAQQLLDAAWRVDELSDIGELVRLAQTAS